MCMYYRLEFQLLKAVPASVCRALSKLSLKGLVQKWRTGHMVSGTVHAQSYYTVERCHLDI